MKAYVLHGINDLRYEDISDPEPREGMALVKVGAAGICGSDIPRIYRTGTYAYPLIPGHEFAGVVTKTGKGVDKTWQGRRVGIFPLMPCGRCMQCKGHRYEMCEHYGYLGSRNHGGFADYAEVPVWNLLALPESVSLEQAAMLEPMAVAVHAIRSSGLAAGCHDVKNPAAEGFTVAHSVAESSIVVCGLGTIGLLVLMFLRELGCNKVFAVGNKAFQKTYALKLGLPENCCYDNTPMPETEPAITDKGKRVQDWILKMTGQKGADLFFDCTGTNNALMYALGAAAPGGMVQLVGNPAGDIVLSPKLYSRILRRQLTLKGTWNSFFDHDEKDDWHYVLQRLEEGKICPEKLITHRMPMEELQRGFALMRDKSEGYVKVMGIREK